MERHITRELHDLGMKGVRFAVCFAPVQDNPDLAGRYGLDQVEFLISANPGEPMKPLVRIASGGEACPLRYVGHQINFGRGRSDTGFDL